MVKKRNKKIKVVRQKITEDLIDEKKKKLGGRNL